MKTDNIHNSNEIVYMYSISCPKTGKICYIGKTINPKERFRKHLTAVKKTATYKWISSLKKIGMKPIFNIILETTTSQWQKVEKDLIKQYKDSGHPLLNHTEGGEGGNTMGGKKLTKEQTLKISLSKIGKKRPDLIGNKFQAKKVVQFDLSGNKIAEYNSIKEAARAIGRSDRRIQYMVRGEKINGKNINQVGGYKFALC